MRYGDSELYLAKHSRKSVLPSTWSCSWCVRAGRGPSPSGTSTGPAVPETPSALAETFVTSSFLLYLN